VELRHELPFASYGRACAGHPIKMARVAAAIAAAGRMPEGVGSQAPQIRVWDAPAQVVGEAQPGDRERYAAA